MSETKKPKPSIMPSRRWRKATELPDKELIRKLFPKRVVDAMEKAGEMNREEDHTP